MSGAVRAAAAGEGATEIRRAEVLLEALPYIPAFPGKTLLTT